MYDYNELSDYEKAQWDDQLDLCESFLEDHGGFGGVHRCSEEDQPRCKGHGVYYFYVSISGHIMDDTYDIYQVNEYYNSDPDYNDEVFH